MLNRQLKKKLNLTVNKIMYFMNQTNKISDIFLLKSLPLALSETSNDPPFIFTNAEKLQGHH